MKKFCRVICAIIFVIIFLDAFTPVYAQETDTTFQSFEKMTDDFMVNVLSNDKVIGAAIAVVKDGEVFYEKGFGYADLENNIPVDAQTTAFQIASVSKLFTATAAMQMVEQGKLLLDEDVNNYLTVFKINNPYTNPVTLRSLLTHTSGLDDQIPLYISSSGEILFESLDSLENVLKEELPPVVRNPGTFCQYNVFGMALVGYLVEIASGMPIEQYISENILLPLEMSNSSYGLTETILPTLSKPYKYQWGKLMRGNYTLINNHPSGSICASASDMAKFMITHLNNGGYKGKSILSADLTIAMHSHQYPKDDRLTGYGLGFYETIRNGYRTIEHGGYLPSFSSKLSILPDKNIGVFIAINTDSKNSSKVCNKYIELFYDFFTDSQINRTTLSDNITFDMDADKLSGRYSFTGYGETNFTKIKSVLLTCKVKCDDAGNLNFSSNEFSWNFNYIGNGMFYCKENQNYCRLSETNDGWVLNILGSDYEKVNSTNAGLFVISLFCQPIFAISFLLLLRSLIKNKNQKIRFYLILKIILMAQNLLIMSYFVLNAIISLMYVSGDTFIVINVIQPMIFFLCISCIGISLVSAILIVILWIKQQTNLRRKLLYSALTALSFPNIAFMFFMNGMRF